jgi:hypothetical protein
MGTRSGPVRGSRSPNDPGLDLSQNVQAEVSRDGIECIAREMIERFGSNAVNIARWQAEIVAAVPDMLSAKMWRDIAGAVEGLSRKP